MSYYATSPAPAPATPSEPGGGRWQDWRIDDFDLFLVVALVTVSILQFIAVYIWRTHRLHANINKLPPEPESIGSDESDTLIINVTARTQYGAAGQTNATKYQHGSTGRTRAATIQSIRRLYKTPAAMGWWCCAVPTSGFITLLLWYIAIIVAKPPVYPLPLGSILKLADIILMLGDIMWLFFRVTEVLSLQFQQKQGRQRGVIDELMFQSMVRVIKGIIAVCFALAALQVSGFPVVSLITGLGIVGIAVGLAAQDVVRNVFGGVIVALGGPFSLGDWVIVNGIEGTVEAMGWRTVRLRGFDNSATMLPNCAFLTSPVQNLYQAPNWRVKANLRIPAEVSSTAVSSFLDKVRKVIPQLKLLQPNGKAYLTDITVEGWGVEVYCFMQEGPIDDLVCDWNWWDRFLQVREELLLQLWDAADESGFRFASIPEVVHVAAAQMKKP